MRNKNVLYQNKVYSTRVDLYDISFGDHFYIEGQNQSHRDEDLYPNILYPNGNPKPASLTPETKFFIYDDEATDVRNNYLRMIKNSQLNLSFSREIIADEHYPIYVEYYRPFKRLTARRQTAIMFGEYQLEFGRRCLVDMIRLCRYHLAWPEIREIILHDDSNQMKLAARRVLYNFPEDISVSIIFDAFQYLKDNYFTRILVDMVDSFPSPKLVPCLVDAFDRYYHYYPSEYMHTIEIYGGHTIQDDILKACEKIPSVSSLRLLEEGLSHPYRHVEHQAMHSIRSWIRNTAEYVSLNLSFDHKKLVKELNEARWKYNVHIYNVSESIFPKKFFSIKQ